MAAGNTAPDGHAEDFDFAAFLRDGGERRIRGCVRSVAREFRGLDADEAAQEVLMRAHVRHRDLAFASGQDVIAWCGTVARNLFVDARRCAARRPAVSPLHLVRESDTATPDHAEATAQTLTLRAAFRRLPHRQARAIWATEIEQRSQADVAVAMGTTVDGVKQLRRRGFATLREWVIVGPAMLAALAGGLVRLVRRACHIPYPAMGVSLVALVLAPVIGPSRPLLRPTDPATQETRSLMPVRERRPDPDGRLRRDLGGQKATAGRAATPRGPVASRRRPDVRVQTCVAVGTQRSVCGRTGPPLRSGDSVYVTLPGSLVGAEDVTVEYRENEIPVCAAMPTTPVSGCTRDDPEPPDRQGAHQ